MNEQNAAQSRESRDGIRLDVFHAVAFTLFAVLAFVLLLSTYLTSRGYTRMQEATERCITAQQAAMNMQAGSDFLSAKARAFIATGDAAQAAQFFEEADLTRRREHALEDIERLMDSPSACAYLRDAMNTSNELMEIECYAMRLAAESYGCDPAGLPAALSAVALEPADLRLSPEAQRSRALSIVFDESYQARKDVISRDVSLSLEQLIGETREQQRESSSQLLRLIRREEILIIIMLLMALLLVLLTTGLVIRPLRSYVDHIRRDSPLPEKGSSELRFLARAFNQVHERELQRRRQLSYDATHDALTGVFNRSVFEKLRSRCIGKDNALLIIDLDRFKEINDQYGHDVGDRALCCVASLLQEHFRAEDYICRIGGDEFAVIMVHAGSAIRTQIEDKFRRINDYLRTPRDGLPSMSLSVGVAFAGRESPDGDIFHDADVALYRSKNAGLGHCTFY